MKLESSILHPLPRNLIWFKHILFAQSTKRIGRGKNATKPSPNKTYTIILNNNTHTLAHLKSRYKLDTI